MVRDFLVVVYLLIIREMLPLKVYTLLERGNVYIQCAVKFVVLNSNLLKVLHCRNYLFVFQN